MPIIRNNLNSRILVHLIDGKSIDLLEKSIVEITDDALSSSHLQDLIQRGFVIKENEANKEVENESGKAGKLENPKKEKETKNAIGKDLNKEKEEKDLNKGKKENLNKEEVNKDEKDGNLNTEKENETFSKQKEEECLKKENEVNYEADENSAPKKGSNTKKGK